MDLTDLNKFVKRPVHRTRVPREVVAAIPPAMKVFTTLDSRHEYWQVPLDELSSKLTTFLTPWGAYWFLRNAMGQSSAGDEHYRCGDEALSGMSNFQIVVEDVNINNRDIKSHVNSVLYSAAQLLGSPFMRRSLSSQSKKSTIAVLQFLVLATDTMFVL